MSSPIDDLANEILQHAAARGLTVCTAESCSAGRLAIAFARGEGASESFHGGIVAYTKDAKVRLLGVSLDLIREGTAVCGAVAEAMALGALRRSEASLGVSV